MHFFEAVENGQNDIRDLHSLITLQLELNVMKTVLPPEELEKTITYQMHQSLLIKAQDFLIET